MQSLIRITRRKLSTYPSPTTFNFRASRKNPFSHAASMDKSTPPSQDQAQDQDSKAPLALPSIPTAEQTRTIDLSPNSTNTSIKLDHLGPMVVNTDGTLSRIANWSAMAAIEQKNTLRIIGKRNQDRLKVLREKDAEGTGSGSEI